MNEMHDVASHIAQRFDMKVTSRYDLDRLEKDLENSFVLKEVVKERVC